MLLNIQQLYELFESSGNYLRIHWDEDYQRLARHLAEERIKVEKLVVEASPDGVLIRLWNFFANHQIWDEIVIARTFPQLHAIVNYGGQQHGALCLSLAAWLIDQGYTVLAESWVNGRRVDLITECRTWLIECGDTSPKPIISHLYSGVSRVVIVPFQSQEERWLEAVTFTKSANWANNLVEQEQIVDLSSQTEQITIKQQLRKEKQVTSAQYSRNQVTLAADANPFIDYANHKSANTVMAQRADLELFATFLQGQELLQEHKAGTLHIDPTAWANITHSMVDGFVSWQIQEGHAIASINRRLSTIKNYAKLATKAGTLNPTQYILIKAVNSFSKTEAKRINAKREVTRVGDKKATPVRISPEAAKQLKSQPATPQGRRDALLMCLLLDHGLRVGEVAALLVGNFDLAAGTFTFDRPKVDGEQTHKLSADTLHALIAWVHSGDCPQIGQLLRESRKGGKLTKPGMSERAIQARVEFLGEQIGIFGLSPHDCRHHWATFWANKVDLLRLQEAGGWASLEMPRRYVERAKVANEGMA